ncbi:MAG: hypothetical protein ACLPV8_14545 [Steroidobacteraceae bacterium]
MKKLVLPLSAVAGLACLSAEVDATPVTYDYTNGYVVITGATVAGTSIVASGQPPLDLSLGSASQATFDTGSTPAELDSFDFVAPGSLSVNLTGALPGGGNLNSATFVLSNVTATLAAPISVTSTGGSSYQINGASVDISGTYSLDNYVNSSNVTKSIGPVKFGPNAQALGGFINSNGNTLELDAISLGTFTIQGQTFAVDGDIIFDGVPVPLPGAVWMLVSGLGLLGVPFVRRHRAG